MSDLNRKQNNAVGNQFHFQLIFQRIAIRIPFIYQGPGYFCYDHMITPGASEWQRANADWLGLDDKSRAGRNPDPGTIAADSRHETY